MELSASDEAEPGGDRLRSLYVEPERPPRDRLGRARVPRRVQDLPLGTGRDRRAARAGPADRARRDGGESSARREAARARCWPSRRRWTPHPPARCGRAAVPSRAWGESELADTALARSRSSSSPTTSGRPLSARRTSPRAPTRRAVAIPPRRPTRRSRRSGCRAPAPSAPRPELSGGEQQRVAIAAAAARGPAWCSPTSRPASWTEERADRARRAARLRDGFETTVLVVTHSDRVAAARPTA